MGFSRKRVGKDGKPRYTAGYLDIRGRERSAGTFSNKKDARDDLRHVHASWLLHCGADLQVVKERLGHASIATTERYLHSLPTADETALDALSRIRQPQSA
jgi:integrase